MGCKTVTVGDATIIVCSRGRGREQHKPCSVPGCDRPHVALCDFALAGEKTCDARLCSTHRVASGKLADGDQRDLCPAHAKLEARRQGALPGVA